MEDKGRTNPRICQECAASSTYCQLKYRGKPCKFNCWHRDPKEPGAWLCHKCYMKLYIAPKHNPRRMRYKDDTVYLEKNPRTGKCSNPNCKNTKTGKVKTHIHHDEYHDDDPTKDTREICESCHKLEKKSWREEEAMKAVAEMVAQSK